MTDLVTILEEPKGEVYAALLHFALRRNSLFSLVWRDQLRFTESATSVAKTLRRDLVSERRTNEWPGTELIGHLATVRLYRMSPSALTVLNAAVSLYAWTAPERPEDLAFYVTAGVPWLGSIAHERDAFLYRHAVDLHDLTHTVEGLRVEHDNSTSGIH